MLANPGCRRLTVRQRACRSLSQLYIASMRPSMRTSWIKIAKTAMTKHANFELLPVNVYALHLCMVQRKCNSSAPELV